MTFIKQKIDSQPKSQCHDAAVSVNYGEEGTNCYICTTCQKPCDTRTIGYATWTITPNPLYFVECPHCHNDIFMSSQTVIERLKRWLIDLLNNMSRKDKPCVMCGMIPMNLEKLCEAIKELLK